MELPNARHRGAKQTLWYKGAPNHFAANAAVQVDFAIHLFGACIADVEGDARRKELLQHFNSLLKLWMPREDSNLDRRYQKPQSYH